MFPSRTESGGIPGPPQPDRRRGDGARHGERRAATVEAEREGVMFAILAAAAVTVSIAIGVVCLIAGGVYLFRGKMMLGVILIIIGILLGGLSIFGVID